MNWRGSFLRWLRRMNVVVLLIAQLYSFGNFDFGFFSVPEAEAAIPVTIGYQGRLKNASGSALTGTYTFTFRLYDASSGGSPLWTEIQPNISVDQSYFSVQLGAITPFPSSVNFNQQLYLTTDVNGDGEMTPRIPINTVPYAYTAANAESLSSAPASPNGGRVFYNSADGTLNYYDGAASLWRTVNQGISLQTITDAGALTTSTLQFAGGTSTADFAVSGALNVTGAASLQDFTFLGANGTAVTSTNLFATNSSLTNATSTGWFGFATANGTTLTAANLNSGNVSFSGGNMDGVSIGISSPAPAIFTSVSSTNATSTNLFVSNLAALPTNTSINGQSVCL
ncbi:MAG TPA: hypothetical protein VFQ60_01475, partial [Patescibacteria group bacterium]|nr:hypothetical protein [Patescibacteria group bacterium]